MTDQSNPQPSIERMKKLPFQDLRLSEEYGEHLFKLQGLIDHFHHHPEPLDEEEVDGFIEMILEFAEKHHDRYPDRLWKRIFADTLELARNRRSESAVSAISHLNNFEHTGMPEFAEREAHKTPYRENREAFREWTPEEEST